MFDIVNGQKKANFEILNGLNQTVPKSLLTEEAILEKTKFDVPHGRYNAHLRHCPTCGGGSFLLCDEGLIVLKEKKNAKANG